MPYVLVVDDNQEAANAIADVVRLLGWQAEVAPGPRAALHAVQRVPPALILLDLNMAGISGLEVLKFIKRDPSLIDIPVVFISAEDDPDTQQKTREAGALDYLVKPVDLDRLEAILEKVGKK